MSKITLSQALKEPGQNLGSDFQFLGSKSQFFGHKILLSYSSREGFKFVSLNFIQLFLRKVLGFYKNTHLEGVIFKWNAAKTKDKEWNQPKFDERIAILWKKTYPQKELPPYYVVLGNCDIEKANLFLFGEVHTSKTIRKVAAEWVEKFYRQPVSKSVLPFLKDLFWKASAVEKDVIFVEGLSCKKEKLAKDHQQTRFLNPLLPIRGWEPKNFKEIAEAQFKGANHMYQRLLSCYERIKALLPKNDHFSDKDLEPVEKELKLFCKEYVELSKYYVGKIRNLKPFEEQIFDIFNQLKMKKLSQEGNQIVFFKYIILSLLENLERMQESALYRNPESCDIKATIANFSLRNDSIVHCIQKYSTLANRLFFHLGLSHAVRTKNGFIQEIPQIKKELSNRRYIVVCRYEDYIKLEVAKRNPELRRIL